MASSGSEPGSVARMPAIAFLTLARLPSIKAWRSKPWSTSPSARRGVGGTTIRCTPSALATAATFPTPARRVTAWHVGVVDPYGGRWSRAINNSAADAALRTCLFRTLNTPDVRGRAA
jgi:hypothetical protein